MRAGIADPPSVRVKTIHDLPFKSSFTTSKGNSQDVEPSSAHVLGTELVRLLQDDDTRVVRGTLFTLAKIARRRNTAEAVVGVQPAQCTLLAHLAMYMDTLSQERIEKLLPKLGALLRDDDVRVVQSALYAISEIATLEDVRNNTCDLLANLSYDDDSVSTILELCPRLVTLFRESRSTSDVSPSILGTTNAEVIGSLIQALLSIGRSKVGAQAVMDAGTLELVAAFLDSPHPMVRSRGCSLVGKLACHRSILPSTINLCQKIVALLHDRDPSVVANATYPLFVMCFSEAGAKAAVDAGALEWVAKLANFLNVGVRRRVGLFIGRIAAVESLAALTFQHCTALVSLLQDEDIYVVKNAASALANIYSSQDGATAVLDSGALDYVDRWKGSRDTGLRHHSHWIVHQVDRHTNRRPRHLHALSEAEIAQHNLSSLNTLKALLAAGPNSCGNESGADGKVKLEKADEC
ncbi:armadillo-type protein [Mycena crocata]|nr:armadillo-type protein [Mycena crocata]